MSFKQIFSVHDSAIEASLDPFFALTVAEARRSFAAAVQREGTPFNTNPQDYTLFHLGEFDPKTRGTTRLPIDVVIANGAEFTGPNTLTHIAAELRGIQGGESS